MTTIEKPAIVTDLHLSYLDMLQARGSCNMYDASIPLAEAFELSKAEARTIVAYWMRTYSEPNNNQTKGDA